MAMDGTNGRATTRPRGQLSSAISELLVRLLNEYTGRGPTMARTYLLDDVITVVMRDTLTKAERSLVENGKAEHVRQTRRCFQETMRDDIIAGIQELTGRRVIAFLSDNHIDPDVASKPSSSNLRSLATARQTPQGAGESRGIHRQASRATPQGLRASRADA
jgi:uncharacterized protein YbcI